MTQPLRAVPLADGRAGLRHVFVRDLLLECRVGVHKHERLRAQPVRVNLDLSVRETPAKENAGADKLVHVVDYEVIVERTRKIAARGHVNLIETLAERIAAVCLEDARVRAVRVRVEKLDVFPDAASVGVEIERFADA